MLDVHRGSARRSRRRAGPRRPASAWRCASRGRWCARARRPARPAGARASTASTSSSVSSHAAVGDRPPRAGPPGPRAAPAVLARPWVSTSPTTTSVPRLGAAVRLAEHGVGLADPRCRAEVDPQLTARAHGVIIRPWCPAAAAATARFSPVTFTPGSPRNPSPRPSVASATSSRTSCLGQPGDPGDPRHLQLGVGGADVRVEPGAGRGDGVGRHGARVDALARGDRARRCSTWPSSSSENPPWFEPPEVEGSPGPRTSSADADGPGVEVRVGGRVGGHRVDRRSARSRRACRRRR